MLSEAIGPSANILFAFRFALTSIACAFEVLKVLPHREGKFVRILGAQVVTHIVLR